MEKLPTWLKIALGVLLFAILYGGAQFLLYMDQGKSARFGLD